MIENLDEAVRFFNREVLFNQANIVQVFNGERGPLAKRLAKPGMQSYVVFFKKSWNPYFGRKFRMPGYEIGQTTNLNILEKAAQWEDIIGIVHPNHDTYTCPSRKWLLWAREHGTIWIPTGEINQEASIPKELLTLVRKDGNNNEQERTGLDAYL